MKQNKHQEPLRENTKDDSSDIERVKQDKQSSSFHPKAESRNNPSSQNRTTEEEEAEKGHA